jgi:MYXO-CTERM domain-containing protein
MKMGTASAQQHFDSLYACLGGCASSTTGAGGNGGTGGSTGVGGSGASTGVGGSGASTGSPSCGLGPPSLALDGNGSFVIPNPITTADFTIEVWLQTDVSGPATSDFFSGAGVIYGDMNNVQNAFGTAISGVSYIFGIGNPDQSVISVTPVVGLGWVHVAAVRSVEAGTITLVINGIAETPKPVVNTGVLSATTQLYVGGSEKYHFEGQLDEIRIWRVARSASEIASTMNQSLKGNEPDLIAYYPLHEGSGLEVSERVHGGSVALNGGNPPAPTWSSKCESSSQGQGGSGQPEGGSGNGEGAFGNSSSMGASDNAAAGAANPQTVAFFCSTHAGSSEPPPPPLSAAFLGMALGLVVRRRAVSR